MQKRTDPVLPDQGGRHTPADPLSPVTASHDELVREKAHEIYQRRGEERGREVEHWLEAERELTDGQRRYRDSLLLTWTH